MTTCEPLPQDNFGQTALWLTPSVADSPARTLVRRAKEPALMEREAGFGTNTPASFANFDQESSSWRTWQVCLDGDLAEFSERWPRSGMMRSGTAYRLNTLAHPTRETGYGLLPTPMASDNRNRGDLSTPCIQRRHRLGKQTHLSHRFKGVPCPSGVEGMMGFPRGWLNLD